MRKELSALLVALILGTSTICFAEEKITVIDDSQTVQKEETIKANKDTYKKITELMNAKNYQEAIKYLDVYIDSKPSKYEVYKLRGECYMALHQFAQAQKDFEKAIDLKTSDDKFITGTKVISAVVLGADKQEQYQNPELGILYGELMYAQMAQNDLAYETTYQKAMEYNSHQYLQKPKKTDIAKINYPQKYGKVWQPQGVDKQIQDIIEDIENEKLDDAIYKIPNIISEYPEYYYGYYLMGVVLAEQEQTQEAISSFNNALKYNPKDPESYASLGQIYYYQAEKTFSQDDVKISIENFENAIRLNPNNYTYNYYLGLNNLLINKYNSAISDFNNAINIKSDDYNSLYYKSIAEYLNGDYNSVIDITSKMLYKHVSNYNSVLYLRALAYAKLNKISEATADIEKIESSYNDIYNEDVKVTSKKEQTLPAYVSYLKYQIEKELKEDYTQSYNKAIKNPIVATLAKTDKTVQLYVEKITANSSSEEEIKKYQTLYNAQLLHLTNSNFILSSEDVENQYDYIRTAFADLNLTMSYTNNNYKFALQDTYNNIKDNQISYTSTANDLGLEAEEPSLARMLAAGELFQKSKSVETINQTSDATQKISTVDEIQNTKMAIQPTDVEITTDEVKKDTTSEELKTTISDIVKPVLEDGNNEEQGLKNYTITYGDSPKTALRGIEPEEDDAPSNNTDKGLENYTISYDTNPLKAEEKPVEKVVEQTEQKVEEIVEPDNIFEQKTETIKSAATEPMEDEDKGLENYKITYDNSTNIEETLTKNIENNLAKGGQFVEDTTSSAAEEVKQEIVKEKTYTPGVINEKHANVNLKDFNTVNSKKLEISNGDEIIELEPKQFLKKETKVQKEEPIADEDSLISKITNENIEKNNNTLLATKDENTAIVVKDVVANNTQKAQNKSKNVATNKVDTKKVNTQAKAETTQAKETVQKEVANASDELDSLEKMLVAESIPTKEIVAETPKEVAKKTDESADKKAKKVKSETKQVDETAAVKDSLKQENQTVTKEEKVAKPKKEKKNKKSDVVKTDDTATIAEVTEKKVKEKKVKNKVEKTENAENVATVESTDKKAEKTKTKKQKVEKTATDKDSLKQENQTIAKETKAVKPKKEKKNKTSDVVKTDDTTSTTDITEKKVKEKKVKNKAEKTEKDSTVEATDKKVKPKSETNEKTVKEKKVKTQKVKDTTEKVKEEKAQKTEKISKNNEEAKVKKEKTKTEKVKKQKDNKTNENKKEKVKKDSKFSFSNLFKKKEKQSIDDILKEVDITPQEN